MLGATTRRLHAMISVSYSQRAKRVITHASAHRTADVLSPPRRYDGGRVVAGDAVSANGRGRATQVCETGVNK